MMAKFLTFSPAHMKTFEQLMMKSKQNHLTGNEIVVTDLRQENFSNFDNPLEKVTVTERITLKEKYFSFI